MRKESTTIQKCNSRLTALGLNSDAAFHRSKLILKIYRDVVWVLSERAEELQETAWIMGEQDIESGLCYLENFAPDIELQAFEEKVCCLVQNQMLVNIIDRALLRLKRYPDRGELYYEILTKQFIYRFNSTEKELLEELNIDRSVFYSTFPIREQAKRGEWDYELKAVYVVGILNFSFDNSDEEYFHHEVKLVDLYTHKVFYDKLTFVYLEMPKFNKTEDELDSMFDKWLFVLRNLASLLERPRALQNRVFDRLFETAEIAKFTKTELSEYWDSLKNFRDWYSVISTAEKKGIEIGMEKGREEGREEGVREANLNNARNLKKLGIAIDVISQATGLSKEEIEKL